MKRCPNRGMANAWQSAASRAWRWLGAMLLACGGELRAAEPSPPAATGPAAIRPLLVRYCGSCHGESRAEGGLKLAALADDAPPTAWLPVWDRLRTRHMPPDDQPQPTAAERAQILSELEAVFARHRWRGSPDPGPLVPRRLNVREQMNAFRDLAVNKNQSQPRKVSYAPKPDGTLSLYGSVVPPAEHPCGYVARVLPPDTSDGGFDTIADNLSLPPFLLEKYFRASKLLLDDLFTSNAARPTSYQWPLYQDLQRSRSQPQKGQTPRQALAGLLQQFASRAFRRPVREAELEKHLALFDESQRQGEEFEASVRLPLQAILTSPRFVLLWADEENPGEAPPGVRPLDDFELAARLSFFLWSSLPDRDLTQRAEQGKLRDPVEIEAQVRRMLADRRVMDGLLAGFVGGWLQLDRLERQAPDAERFPEYFQLNLAELMRQELLLFADAMLVEDRSVLEFISADWGFLCHPLAQHYAFPDFPGSKPASNVQPPWRRVTYADGRRGGVLTLGKVLTGCSQPQRTSPVHRGKWLLETVLGAPPPPPPPNVDNQLPENADPDAPQTVPQRLARHRSQAACAACHRRIDPLGLALENFDPIGRWRDTDLGQPIDARVVLADGRAIHGVAGLKAALVAEPNDFLQCFAERMLTYALGRKLEFYDVPTVRRIAAAAAEDGHRFSRIVVETALSYPFRHRRAGQTPPASRGPE